jgi:hypothetical protein
MTALLKVDTKCTAPSRIPRVNGNAVRSFSTHGQQSAAKGSLTTVSRSDIRLIRYLDSALGLVRRWLLTGYFPILYNPVSVRRPTPLPWVSSSPVVGAGRTHERHAAAAGHAFGRQVSARLGDDGGHLTTEEADLLRCRHPLLRDDPLQCVAQLPSRPPPHTHTSTGSVLQVNSRTHEPPEACR